MAAPRARVALRARTGGTAGTGGSPPPPASVDETCRDWCANEPVGISCYDGPLETIQSCYEDCLVDYQSEIEPQCENEWISIKDCQVGLECQDLFGDCDIREEQYEECRVISANRDFCETNCPEFDLEQCEQDPADCQLFLQANSYCESRCPLQDRSQCIQQYQSSGGCEQEDATIACQRYCPDQSAGECIDQWLATGACEWGTELISRRSAPPTAHPKDPAIGSVTNISHATTSVRLANR